MYNEGIKLMALSTEMKKTHKFWAFANDIIHTSGDEVDLHSVEVEIADEVLKEVNDQVGYFRSKNLSKYFSSYIKLFLIKNKRHTRYIQNLCIRFVKSFSVN